MKKVFSLISVCTIICLASCNKYESLTENTDISKIKFNVSVSNPSGNDTKGSYKSDWALGDILNVWLDYNYQAAPDFVLSYDGAGWNVISIRVGAAPQASGYIRAFYEEKNDLNKYTSTTLDYVGFTQFAFERRKQDGDEYFMTPYCISSYPIAYTVSNNVLSADINVWYQLLDISIFVSDLEAGDWCLQMEHTFPATAMYVSNYTYENKPEVIELSNGKEAKVISSGSSKNYVYNKEVDGGCVFFLRRATDFTNEDITYTLYNAATKHSFSYTAKNKTLSLPFDRCSAPVRINLTAEEFGITPMPGKE